MSGGFHVSGAASDCKMPCPLALPTGFSFCWAFASVMAFPTKVAVVIVLSPSRYCMGIVFFPQESVVHFVLPPPAAMLFLLSLRHVGLLRC